MTTRAMARWLVPFARVAVSRAANAIATAMTVAWLLSFAIMCNAEPASASSQWTAPVQPVTVVSAFDPPAQRWQAGHRGVDLAGTGFVRAAGGGTVTFAGQLAGRGVVSVSHGRLRTTYEPVDATVAVGQTVAAGQPIGTIGTGGHCSRRCLHWGLLAGDEYLDPMLLLRTDPPVLKPLTAAPAQSRSAPRTVAGAPAEPDSVAGRRAIGAGTRREEATASTVEEDGGRSARSRPAASGSLGVAGIVGLVLVGSAGVVGARRARRRRLR